MIDKYPPLSVALGAKDVSRWVESQEPAVPKGAEEIAKMSAAERIDYCRRFDQSKMPPWRDPRT
jgi:hypothetical protein